MDDIVMGQKYARVAGKHKINSNVEYKIVGFPENLLMVRGMDGVDRALTQKSSGISSTIPDVTQAMPYRGRHWVIVCISKMQTHGLSLPDGSA